MSSDNRCCEVQARTFAVWGELKTGASGLITKYANPAYRCSLPVCHICHETLPDALPPLRQGVACSKKRVGTTGFAPAIVPGTRPHVEGYSPPSFSSNDTGSKGHEALNGLLKVLPPPKDEKATETHESDEQGARKDK